jgi:preprotein translocase subunit YajC
MPDLLTQPLVVAMAQPGPGQGNIWVQLFPFALMLLIFYLIVLMPMRKRQKKVQEFQTSLKVGDRVITTGGIHGLVTRLSEGSVQVQIADRVRIEITRAGIAGYQGQEPVVQDKDAGAAS